MQEQYEPSFDELLTEGTRLLHQRQSQQAAVLLEQACELRPDHLDAAINLGGAYILSGRFRSAVRVLEKAVEIDPHSAMAWTNLGAAYLGNPVLARDPEQLRAIAAFQKVLEIQPQAPNIAYNIGLIYRDRQEWGQAALWFGEAVEADPGDRDAGALLNKMIKLQEKRK